MELEDEGRESEGEDLATGGAAQLDRVLAGLLTLRSSPLALVNLTLRVADQTTSIVVYLYPRGGVLEELITVDGFHHFSLPTREAVPERLARYVDQAGVAAEEDGESVAATIEQLDSEDSEIGRRLRDTRALTVVTSAGGAGTAQLSIMATADAVFAMDNPTAGRRHGRGAGNQRGLVACTAGKGATPPQRALSTRPLTLVP